MIKVASMVKPKGNISSVFGHLGAKENTLDPSLLSLKKEIAPKDPSILDDAYSRVVTSFEAEKSVILEKGPSIIPQVEFKDLADAKFPKHMVDEIRKRGCVVVRNVYDQEEARSYKNDIESYIKQNKEAITGFPEQNPQVFELYWSRPQVKARSHKNFTKVTVALNHLWHATDDTIIDLSKNLVYCDRLRIRSAGDASFALQEHIDSGSLERWQDPTYRKCYTDIFNGNWENYDPYEATHRVNAKMDLYGSAGGCSVFRNFQGWVAMSHITPGGGTLRVCPLIKESTAYFMMKPLLRENLDKNDYCGAFPGLSQYITATDHPLIRDSMVSLPEMRPGDAIFWHCDQVHSVEHKNEMSTDSSVLYIPSVPMCSINSEYLAKQKEAFLEGL
ncbi:DUF1479-domain-containing protein [Backusella circina FSU 941]|nr:DUF1479-domain-containing protein [Backusella circina FSU 941]